MKLVIGNKNYSSWSLRPWLFISYHKLNFEEIRIPLFEDGYKEQLLVYSGTGKAPVLVDDDVTVWDSLATCEYESEKYLSNAGWPDYVDQRALARCVSAEMHSGFPAIRNLLPMNVRATGRQVALIPELQAEVSRIDELWGDLRRRYGEGGPWLFGRFSIADCLYAPVGFRFNTYGIELANEAKTYLEFVLDHPLMQDWLNCAKSEEEVNPLFEVGTSETIAAINRVRRQY